MTDPSRRDEAEERYLAEACCPQCGSSRLVERHCKAICEACGYVESCEDNFPSNAPAVGERHD